jgi:hypothetical protein
MIRYSLLNNFKKRNGFGSIKCELCGEVDSAENIFVQCVLSRLCWSITRDVLEWSVPPDCMKDLFTKLIEGSSRSNRNFVFLFWLISMEFVVDQKRFHL